MKKLFPDLPDLDGYDVLWAGHVSEEDIPETARKSDGEGGDDEEEEKPKKKSGRLITRVAERIPEKPEKKAVCL
jgi:hypothetical protein